MKRNDTMKSFDLEAHLAQEHGKSPVSRYLREIVFGGSDGIVTTFAVVAGFAGAQQGIASGPLPLLTVLLFGLANLFADGVSMGLGSFLSLRAEQDAYRSQKAKEAQEIKEHAEDEFTETVEILRRKKFSYTDAKSIANLYKKNPEYWTQFMMDEELELPNPEQEKAGAVALSTFISFVVFGAIPLAPFMLGMSNNLFELSVGFTAGALLLLGFLRSVVTKRHHVWAVIETMVVGGLSASVAYVVGTFFRL